MTTQDAHPHASVYRSLLREQCFIGGRWMAAERGAHIPVINPATGDTLGTVPDLGLNEIRQAIAAAKAALPSWQRRSAAERAAVLRRWFELMVQHRDELAALMTAEQGKPLGEARVEIDYAASYLEWYAEEARRVYGETIPGHSADKRILVMKQPVGVCAAITPWNFPSAMITRKVGPALAAGCTMVLKPASATPYSALALALLAQEAGVPDGVFSVVTGRASLVGTELATNPDVRKLSFTGSTEVGRVLLAQCAASVMKVSMELGGNAPFIVFDDADIEKAVAGAIASKFRNAGQACVSANRIYIQAGIHDEFATALAIAVRALRVGDGFTEGVQVGPLIDRAAVEKVEQHIDDAISKGAEIVVGGRRHANGGTYFEPTVLVGVDRTMLVAREETFGPVAPLFKFQTEEQVLDAANATEFGLASYFYTQDIERFWRVSERLESGIVGVNTGLISTAVAPFGGIKQSGLGREGSRHGIEDYLEMKYVCVGL